MALSVLYIGGTGQISLPCVEASVRAGHRVTVLNRGRTAAALPTGVKTLAGDMNDAAYGELAGRRFDVVAQFCVYAADQMKRDIAAFTGKAGTICLHLFRLRLREACPALHDDGADAARKQVLAV